MVATRAQLRQASEDTLSTLIANMLDAEGQTKFKDGLNRLGIIELEDFTSMDPYVLDNLKYVTKDANNATIITDPPEGDKRKVAMLLTWLTVVNMKASAPLTLEEYANLDLEDFKLFRRTYNPLEANPAICRQNSVSSIDGSQDYKQQQEIEVFKRSIKRDPTIYPSLREDSQWDSWNRNVLTLAKTHDVSEVFDPNYVPNDELSKQLFMQKQYFVYSVFVRTILTDMGKTIVRENQDSCDAQKVYKNLVSYHKRSTSADLTIDNLAKQLHFFKTRF